MEFPPVVFDPTTQVVLITSVVSNLFLVLWGVNLWRDPKEFKHKSLILIVSFLVLLSSVLYIILPGIEYISGSEFFVIEIVIGYLYSLFRYGYVTNALVIILGISFIAFGRDNDETYRRELIVAGLLVTIGFILLSLNSATHGFLEWTGSPEASTYLATTFPLLFSVGRVLSDTRLFFFLLIGFRAKQYPLLISSVITLSTTIFLIILDMSVQGFIIEISSFILFAFSLIMIYYFDRRRKLTEPEVA